LKATNASVTTTAAASLYIAGAPLASTNQTITNPYALWVDDGLVKFDGALTVDGTITGDVTGDLTGQADTVSTIAGLAPNTATTQATQGNITTLSGVTSIGASTMAITSGAVDQYRAANDGNPTYSMGSSDTNELIMQAVYHSGAQTLEQVLFRTETAGGTADDGKMVFQVDELASLQIDDGGIDFTANHGISIAGTDILTDSSGAATLSNIDALDATTAATIRRKDYHFKGFCLGISSGNFQFAEDIADPQFPFQLTSDYGDTVIANGSLDDVSTWFRSGGIVIPRACTAIDMVGWAACPGTGEVTISLCKITPGRNSTSAEVPVVVATTTFTALNSNDKLEDFSVGDSGGDGAVTIVTAAIAAGDILMPFVLSPNTKTTYFNMTLEVKG
jgi:hypothetical protein